MGSRKEDEKNEKIIRGLMKLPPNRRCINCNNLGPQYVCTSFWTFVCMICSGIHREFTHRVKSVSMAKFTSQEVEALQNGGNQRAREIYLKNWDFQRQQLPDSSNVDKIREFIRTVYVDRRYAAANSSERPPRDLQGPRIHEDEIRRASSYHSYSQSPPYDYQYEYRRYGKQAAALTRKPGSDKVRYEGKLTSIIYSPGRFSDHAYEDRFANEGSSPGISDFSVSSGGEQFKSYVQFPKFHNDIGISSPSFQRSGSSSNEDVWSQARNTYLESNAERDADGIHRPQRTMSLQSTDSNSASLKSYNSGGLVDFFSEPIQPSKSLQNKVAGIPQPSVATRSVSMDLSKSSLPSELSSSSASTIDLFQLPAASAQAPPVDLFQSFVLSAAPSFNENQPSQTSRPSCIDFFAADLSQQPSTATSLALSHAPSVDLFQSSILHGAPSFNENQPIQALEPSPIDFFADLSQKPSIATSDEKSLELSVPKNEGWATFAVPQRTSNAQVEIPAAVPSSAESSKERFDPFSNFNASMQLPSFEISSVPSSVTSNLWHDGVWNGEEQVMPTNTQPWNAFEDSGTHLSMDALNQRLQQHEFPSADNQVLGLRASEGPDKGIVQVINPVVESDNHDIQSHVSGSSYPPSMLPLMKNIQPNGVNCKSSNPFDYPYDYVENNNMFFDMSSLQAALPDALLPATFHGGIAEPWQPQNTVTPYISSAGQGGLPFVAAQPLSSQIQNFQMQETVASFGGNPFA